MTANGALNSLVMFDNGTASGPSASLIFGGDGNLYGTTYLGPGSGWGTVFKVSTNGDLGILATFTGTGGVSNNGALPSAPLIPGGDGSFYGTAYGGGYGQGTIFRVTTNGVLSDVAYFAKTNGWNPQAGLALGPDGSFYGTTLHGGISNVGVIFRTTSDGSVAVLAHFTGGNGANPFAGLAWSSDGYFYGTTSAGGNSNLGSVFRISTNGVLTSLGSFTGDNGATPYASLTVGPDGKLYGTTTTGGSGGFGTVFRFDPDPVLGIQKFGNQAVLSWSNAAFDLQSAPSATGTFLTIPGATSPYTNTVSPSQRFFRLISH
jgi:uncharacterized repeat protein (TIGR03803 family)